MTAPSPGRRVRLRRREVLRGAAKQLIAYQRRAGRVAVVAIRPHEIDMVRALARAGNVSAARLRAAAIRWLERVADAADPPRCVSCKQLLAETTLAGIIVALPAAADEPPVVVGCCTGCVRSAPPLQIGERFFGRLGFEIDAVDAAGQGAWP